MLTQARLKELLSYDAETGVFKWLVSRGGKPIGSRADNVSKLGYVRISVDYERHNAHRLAFLYVHGKFPDGEVDHINGDRGDNRLINLRVVNRQQQCMNTAKRADNSSGFKGVAFHRGSGRWRARIKKNGKEISLGLYDTPEQAGEAYIEASAIVFGEYARQCP